MKKFISILLCVCLCLSCTVFSFADGWSSSDSTTLSNIYRYMPTESQVNTINSTLSTISTRINNINNNLTDIKGYLVHGSTSIATLVYNIQTWMSPIYNAIVESPVELRTIEGLLGYPTSDGSGTTTWNSYLRDIRYSTTNVGSSNWNMYNNAHGQLFEGTPSSFPSDWYYIGEVNPNGVSNLNPKGWNYGSPLGNIALLLQFLNKNIANSYSYRWAADLTGYNTAQTYSLWTGDTLTTSTFTPSSSTNGLYNWLSNIQAPVARLSYVLASDERIEAQEKAADNEQAVVDNFIDSSGSGAASTSDFSNVSDLSSGFKNNISTDANVSGIWNIFNADNFGWFSQETADQLDTSSSSKKTLRSSGSYPTPLLDKQTEDILKYIGGDNND